MNIWWHMEDMAEIRVDILSIAVFASFPEFSGELILLSLLLRILLHEYYLVVILYLVMEINVLIDSLFAACWSFLLPGV